MKKLVTVFAACAVAGMAVAADSNIVGYTTKTLVANQKAISGAQFVEVGDTGLDLASIKLENVPAEGTAFIQWWNGTDYDTAAWVEIDDDPNNPGWGNAGTWAEVFYTFDAGDGFWIILPGGVSNAKVTQAGEVALSGAATYDTPLAANKKFMMINPLPTTLGLSDIELVGVAPEGTAFIQWWNGSAYNMAAWVEIDDDPNNPGWGNAGTWAEVFHTFNPCDGFWILVPGGVSSPQVKIANKVL